MLVPIVLFEDWHLTVAIRVKVPRRDTDHLCKAKTDWSGVLAAEEARTADTWPSKLARLSVEQFVT
jgi:hypothetical protein